MSEIKAADVLKELNDIKTGLETTLAEKTKDASEATKTEITNSFKEKFEAIEAKITEVKGLPEDVSKEDVSKIKSDLAATIRALDILQTRVKTSGKANSGERIVKTLAELMGEALHEVGVVGDQVGKNGSGGEIEKALKSPAGNFGLKLKSEGIIVKDMTTAGSLTGDPVATYNQRQAIIPGQAINLRDLVPTVQSPTGLYVTYSENSGEVNNIASQGTEGNTKGQNDYALTEVKTVNTYIAGIAVFSKQLLRNLPFMQNTLTRMLLRDFYKAENSAFFTTISGAATGSTAGFTSADDVKQVIVAIGNQRTANYTPSFALVSHTMMSRLIQSTYTNGYYPGAGAVQFDGLGLTIWGVPVISASWVPATKLFIADSAYLERVEVEGLNITFSFEDSDNFRRNKVTARIECYEAINLMRADSAIYADLGAS